jgi:Mg-chelatase subunit ChlD
MSPIPPFHYQVSWRPRSWRAGEHSAAVSGDGGSFRGERPLADASEARFLSIRASLRDPWRRLWVRENQQRATLDLFVVADVSRSMRIGGDGSCCRAAGDLMASAALSAYRGGDRIGAVCASAHIDPRLVVAPTRRVQPVLALARRIRAMPEQAGGREPGLDCVDGMLDAWRRLSMRRSLVLVVSDYHAPIETWTRILQTLRHHQVVPVVLQDGDAMPVLPRWGLVHLDDAESGHSRSLLMRPSLQRRLTAGIDRRQAELASMFERLGLRPCHLRQPFDPAQLTGYFHAGSMAGTRGSRTLPPQPAR